MPQTAIPTAAGETAGSGRAPHYLLAYLEEGRVRVYASCPVLKKVYKKE